MRSQRPSESCFPSKSLRALPPSGLNCDVMKLLLAVLTGLISLRACSAPKASERPVGSATNPLPAQSAERVTVATPASPKCSAQEPEACLPVCDAGDARACFLAGQGFHQLPESRRDDKKAVAAYTRGCDLGKPEACGNLGLQYEEGWGTDRDVGRAAVLYEKACAADVVVACRNVGKLNEGESGYPANPSRSGAAYERALELALKQCDQGRGEGCVAAGYMFQDGKGTPADPLRGDDLVRAAA